MDQRDLTGGLPPLRADIGHQAEKLKDILEDRLMSEDGQRIEGITVRAILRLAEL